MELIGSYVEVVNSENKTLIGLRGKVIDETKFTLIIEEVRGNIKRLIKSHVMLKFNGKTIYGGRLVGKPEDRIKR